MPRGRQNTALSLVSDFTIRDSLIQTSLAPGAAVTAGQQAPESGDAEHISQKIEAPDGQSFGHNQQYC